MVPSLSGQQALQQAAKKAAFGLRDLRFLQTGNMQILTHLHAPQLRVLQVDEWPLKVCSSTSPIHLQTHINNTYSL